MLTVAAALTIAGCGSGTAHRAGSTGAPTPASPAASRPPARPGTRPTSNRRHCDAASVLRDFAAEPGKPPSERAALLRVAAAAAAQDRGATAACLSAGGRPPVDLRHTIDRRCLAALAVLSAARQSASFVGERTRRAAVAAYPLIRRDGAGIEGPCTAAR